ncbi:MAG: L,D-transpeptidase family protein [Bdellovibrionota bacterium]
MKAWLLNPLLVLGMLLSISINVSAQSEDAIIKATISSGLPAGLRKSDLDAFYSQLSYRAVFMRGQQTSNKLGELQASIQRIERHGLNPRDYQKPEIMLAPGSFSANWVMSELTAAQTLINLARNVSTGRVNPSSISSDIKYEQRAFSLAQIYSLAAIGSGSSVDAVIDGVAPKTTEYWNLAGIRAHLTNVRNSGGWADIIPPAKVLKVGVRDAKVVELKRRLMDYGYPISDLSDLYDQQVFRAVVDMQKSFQMNVADGVLGPNGPTWKMLRTSLQSRLDDVDMNMEKVRWLPISLEDRHIFVNLAFQNFRLMDKNLSLQRGMDPALPYMEFRTINGRKERKTPSMKDRITNLVFNPTWTVPMKIFIEDKLPIIKAFTNSSELLDWFDSNGYTVLSGDMTQTLDPLSIDWNSINSANVNIYIRQTPRYNNALGVVKFMMTNPWAIYLHDTNTREVFDRDHDRMQSSGCIRVERPMELAEYLSAGVRSQFLSGDPGSALNEILNFVAKPGEIREKETQVMLPKERFMPVYTLYQTVALGRDGIMRFARDNYGQNAGVKAALRNQGFLR